jgi:hypothetical protein
MTAAHSSKRLPADTTSSTTAASTANAAGAAHSSRVAALPPNSKRIVHRARAASSTAARCEMKRTLVMGRSAAVAGAIGAGMP